MCRTQCIVQTTAAHYHTNHIKNNPINFKLGQCVKYLWGKIKTKLTWTYSAQISIPPTNSHTCSTDHELISSLCAWHFRGVTPPTVDILFWGTGVVDGWLVDDDILSVLILWWLFVVATTVGELRNEPGAGDLMRIRLIIGVELLKSSGMIGLDSAGILDGLVDARRFWLFTRWWPPVELLPPANGNPVGDGKFGEKLDRWTLDEVPWFVVWLFGDVFRGLILLLARFDAPLSICWISASFAARAY